MNWGNIMFKSSFVTSRGSSKTGLQLFYLLEQLKNNADTEEEKQYIEQMQEEWSEFCVGLTWRILG